MARNNTKESLVDSEGDCRKSSISNQIKSWQTGTAPNKFVDSNLNRRSQQSDSSLDVPASSNNETVEKWHLGQRSHSAKGGDLYVGGVSEWDGSTYRQKLGTDDENYGTPSAGTKTDARSRKAGASISNEIVELCQVICDLGQRQSDGTWTVKFGPLFETYTRISNKLVGMLMRARKHGLVQFEGEMLYQRRDDNVVVRLVEVPLPLRKYVEQK